MILQSGWTIEIRRTSPTARTVFGARSRIIKVLKQVRLLHSALLHDTLRPTATERAARIAPSLTSDHASLTRYMLSYDLHMVLRCKCRMHNTASEQRRWHEDTVWVCAWPAAAFAIDICAAGCIRAHEMCSAVLGPPPAAADGSAPSAPSMAVCMRTKTSPDEPLGGTDSLHPDASAVVAADFGGDGEVVGRRCEDCPRARRIS